MDAIETLRSKRGDEQITFGDVADHLVDFRRERPDDAQTIHDLALFLARVEDVDHDHSGDDGGLNEPAPVPSRP